MKKGIKQNIESFKLLGFEEKKKKLILVCETLLDQSFVFQKMIDTIKINQNVDEDFLLDSYIDIMKHADLAYNYTEQEKQKIFNILQQKIDLIHKKEQEEQITENPDYMLENLIKEFD